MNLVYLSIGTNLGNKVENLKNIIDEETAGVFIEPIQGEGGINVATIKQAEITVINAALLGKKFSFIIL